MIVLCVASLIGILLVLKWDDCMGNTSTPPIFNLRNYFHGLKSTILMMIVILISTIYYLHALGRNFASKVPGVQVHVEAPSVV